MENYIYKSDYFTCVFSSPKAINKKLENIINKYAEDGWTLHSYKFVDMNTFCVVVFFKER